MADEKADMATSTRMTHVRHRPRHRFRPGYWGRRKPISLGFWKNMAAFARQLPHRHQWLREMVAHRIADPIILEVIGMA